jgi:hypothetical protein
MQLVSISGVYFAGVHLIIPGPPPLEVICDSVLVGSNN